MARSSTSIQIGQRDPQGVVAFANLIKKDYHPDDLKGKGEPSYSIEKALKDHKTHSRRRAASESHVDVEMTAPRPASSDSAAPPVVDEERYADWAGTLRRNSTGRGEGGGGGVIRKRFESLRRK